jgi:hypothetical protein
LTDDQIGQFTRKTNAILDRTGKSLPFDQVMVALQAIHDGKEPAIPTLIVEPGLAKWRSFLIGGVDKKALLKRVEAGFSVGNWAKDLMKRPTFTTQDAEEEIETIVLTPADFGYTRNPTTTELLDPTRLAEWSAQNAERLDGHVVELLPAEAGPHIRDQYKDQPKDEVLWIAMERITDSDGDPNVFRVERRDDGERWLYARWTGPDDQWNLDGRVVFRLRKVTQA